MMFANSMVLGIIGATLSLLAMSLTAMAFVREREQGTVGQLIVTPNRPVESIAGRVMPEVWIAFRNLLEILFIGIWWFDPTLNGSLGMFLGLAGVFLVASLGRGIPIPTISTTRREAMLLKFCMMLPSTFLTGCCLPPAAMPAALQSLSGGIPVPNVLGMMRSIILKGAGSDMASGEVLALAALGSARLAPALARFQEGLPWQSLEVGCGRRGRRVLMCHTHI